MNKLELMEKVNSYKPEANWRRRPLVFNLQEGEILINEEKQTHGSWRWSI